MSPRNVLIACLFLSCALRLIATDQSPPAFFHDEARAAAHAICLAESGSDATGQWLPLYSPVEGTLHTTRGGGLYPATWTYSAAGWSKIFGNGRAAFRSLAGFFSILSLLLLYLLLRLFTGETEALLAVLVFAFMPASFHLGRLAWENSLIPLFLISGMYFLFSSSLQQTKHREWICLALSALFLNLAALSYPAQRVQIPLLLPALLWIRSGRKRWNASSFSVFLLSLLILALPLLHGIRSGVLIARFDAVSIFDAQWLEHYNLFGAETEPLSGWRYGFAAATAFTWKFLLHFGPKFLFLTGDVNPRHSPQFTGELGLLEAVAVIYFLARIFGVVKQDPHPGENSEPGKTLKWLCAAGFVAGIIPSALTQNSPHALRCIGAFPFVAIWAGIELAEMFSRSKQIRIVSVSIAALFFAAYFFFSYFRYYPDLSAAYFHQDTLRSAVEAAKHQEWKDFVRTPSEERDRMARAYYAMSMGKLTCEEVRPWIRK